MSARRKEFDTGRAARLWAEGRDATVIAASVGINVETFRRAMKRDPAMFPPRTAPRSPIANVEVKKTRVALLLAKGELITEIAADVGISTATIHDWMRKDPDRFQRSVGETRRAKAIGDDARRAARAIVRAANKTRRFQGNDAVGGNRVAEPARDEPVVVSADPVDAAAESVAPEPASVAVPAETVDATPEPVAADAAGETLIVADRRPVGAAAFLPLPGTMPVDLTDRAENGCCFPIDADDPHPLRGTTIFFCNAPRETAAKPYCATHRHLMLGRGSTGERDAHRLTQTQRAA